VGNWYRVDCTWCRGVRRGFCTRAAGKAGTADAGYCYTAATPARRPRLTTPWSQLTDLSDDQKTKILAVIGKTNDDIAAIRKKTHGHHGAMTDDQKKKAEKSKLRERSLDGGAVHQLGQPGSKRL